MLGLICRFVVIATIVPVSVAAQTPPAPEPTPPMDVIARSLGVSCNYCHVSGNFASDANPKKVIARQMIEMTREINARIRTATGKSAAEATRIECVTCHKGAALPRKLTDILARTIVEQSADAAVAQYRELRAKYYGRDMYDFTEPELLAFAGRLAESARPESGIAFAKLVLELNQKAAQAYVVMSRAHTAMRDKPAAIEDLKKALEIEPNNGIAKGYLYQLDPRAAQ